MNKAKEEIGENADYLFPEIDNLDFEAELSEAFKELEANYSHDQELVEKSTVPLQLGFPPIPDIACSLCFLFKAKYIFPL